MVHYYLFSYFFSLSAFLTAGISDIWWQERVQEDRRNEGRDPTSSHLIKDGCVMADLFCLYLVDDVNR